MRIINRNILDKYIKKHRNKDLKSSIINWPEITKKSEWKNQNDIIMSFTKVSFLPYSRLVFNIAGNNYRLSVIVVYISGLIRIEWIGKHKEYDRLDLTKKILKLK
jgi:mRNA interferase HigB